MNSEWIEIVATIAVQHLWQSAMLLGLTLGALKLHPLPAGVRSWIWLAALVLSVLAPLAVFVPEFGAAPAPLAAPRQPAPDAGLVLAEAGMPAPAVAPQPDLGGAQLLDAALALWALGLLWHLARLVQGWNAARRLRRAATPMPVLEGLVGAELPAGTTISACDSVGSPMVVGLMRSCILIPRRLADDLPRPVLYDILNHEIAHVRRRDLWIGVAQQVCTALFWWSPALRLICSRLDLAREMACDEQAVQRAGHGKKYASSLLATIDQLAGHERKLVLASGIFASTKEISQRIEGVLDMDLQTRKYGKKVPALLWGAVMLTVVTVTYAATPRVIEAGTAEVVAVSDAGSVRLIEEVKAGNIDAVRTLVAQGVDVNGGVDGDGTPLIAAARSGNLPMVNALLGLGAKVELAWPGDGNPLIAAAVEGHLAVVDLLVRSGANVNAICYLDETPLINAVRAGRFETVKYLVEHGADVNLGAWADGKRWRTPLNQARDAAIRSYLIAQGATA